MNTEHNACINRSISGLQVHLQLRAAVLFFSARGRSEPAPAIGCVKLLQMNKLTVRMAKDQMRAVLSLADDQIFRLRFIDRKIPGYKYDAQKLESGVLGVEVLRHALKGEQGEVAASAAFNSVAPAKD